MSCKIINSSVVCVYEYELSMYILWVVASFVYLDIVVADIFSFGYVIVYSIWHVFRVLSKLSVSLHNMFSADSLLNWVYVSEIYDAYRINIACVVSRLLCVFVDYTSDSAFLIKGFPQCGYVETTFLWF